MPTNADRKRFWQLHHLGCVACRKHVAAYRAPDVHHILSGGRRISHQATVPLCPWHHRGVVPDEFQDQRQAERILGPSMAISPAGFKGTFGTQEELLAETNRLIEELA